MADLGIKKGKKDAMIKKHDKKKKKKKWRSLGIQALPRELLVDIFAKVASRSIVDLCKVKLSCKEFLRAAEDDHVYQHASMDNFALVPLPWFTHHEPESSFLKRCRESGNLEISYREGMVDYFSCVELERAASGFDTLRKAAVDGHDDAKYVYSMILMCGQDEAERNKGFGMFRCLKESMSIRRCRKRVNCFVRSMWVKNNNPLLTNKLSTLCPSTACHTNLSTPRTWFIEDNDEDNNNNNNNNNNNISSNNNDDDAVSCEYCLADHEVTLFCNMFEA